MNTPTDPLAERVAAYRRRYRVEAPAVPAQELAAAPLDERIRAYRDRYGPPQPAPAAEGGDPTSPATALLQRASRVRSIGSDTIVPPELREPAELAPIQVTQRGRNVIAPPPAPEPDLPIPAAIGRAVARGAGGIVEALGGVTAMMPQDPMIEAMGGQPAPFEESIPGQIVGAGRRIVEQNPASPSVQLGDAFQPENPRWWLERGLEQAPQLALSIGAGLATGGLGGFILPTALQEGGSGYLETRQALLSAGDDEQTAEMKARGAAVLTAAGAAALERIPGSVLLLNRVPGADRVFAAALAKRLAGSAAGRLAAGASAEGIAELGQEAWADVVQFAATQDPAVFTEWQQRYAGAGALGGLMGGVANVAMRSPRDKNEADSVTPFVQPDPVAPAPAAPRSAIADVLETVQPVEPGPLSPENRGQPVEPVPPQPVAPPIAEPVVTPRESDGGFLGGARDASGTVQGPQTDPLPAPAVEPSKVAPQPSQVDERELQRYTTPNHSGENSLFEVHRMMGGPDAKHEPLFREAERRRLGVAYSAPSIEVEKQEVEPMPAPSYRGLEYRDVVSLPWTDLRESAEFERQREKNIEVELFGEEGAKRYKRLQARANSMMATRAESDAAYAEAEKMEEALTEEQRNRLYGIGETGLNADELRDIATAATDYSPETAADWDDGFLRNTVGRELLTGKPDKNAVSAVRLRGALEELYRRGASEADVMRMVVERAQREGTSPADASELFRRTIDSLKGAGWLPTPKQAAKLERKALPPATESAGPSDLFGNVRPPTLKQESLLNDNSFAPAEKLKADEISSRPMSPDEVKANMAHARAEGLDLTERDKNTLDLDLDNPPAPERRERKTTTYKETAARLPKLDEPTFLKRYKQALRTQLTAGAGADAVSNQGARLKKDYADPNQPVGLVGTGAGAFARGSMTQATARVLAYQDEARRRGIKDPSVEQAFIEADLKEIPARLQGEFQALSSADELDLLDRLDEAEETAFLKREDVVAQVRRAMIAGELQRRTTASTPVASSSEDVDEDADDEADEDLPFYPAPDTSRMAEARREAERSAQKDPSNARMARAVRSTSSSGSMGFPPPAESLPSGVLERPIDPLMPEDAQAEASEKYFTRELKGRLETAEEKVARTNAPAVIKALAKIVEVAGGNSPIRTGRIGNKNALGVFKIQSEVIRVLEANDIPVAAHEVAHALEQVLYGRPKGSPWKSPRISTLMGRELLTLGKALYGDRKPYGGYKREGWAEYVRLWITEPDTAAGWAPAFTRWFEGEFSTEFPEVRKAFDAARKASRTWQEQGSRARVEESIIDPASSKERLKKASESIRRAFTMEQWIEMMQPLADLATAAEAKLGRPLEADENPYVTGTALAMTHARRARYMVEDAMIDLAGNPKGDSLQAIRGLVKGRRQEFMIYLYARRAVKLWTDPKGERNPGISLRDARQVLQELDSPQFQLAASKVYEWNNGVLNYAAEASGDFGEIVKKIRQRDPGDYVPLQREFDELDQMFQGRGPGKAARGSLVKRLGGSGRRIKDPFQAMITKAEQTIRQAHARLILEQVLKLSKIEGLGQIIEKVPVNKVPVASATVADVIEKIERELFGAKVGGGRPGGLSIDNPFDLDIDVTGSFVTFFAPAQHPGGKDPIFPVWSDGKVSWYQVDPDLYASLEGLDVYRLAQVDGLLGALVKWGVEIPASIARAGMTSLRASFGLITNPVRDVQTLWTNTQSQAKGRHLFLAWARSLGNAAFAQLGGDRKAFLDAFVRLGGDMALSLGQDMPHTRRATHRLFQGRRARILDPLNWWDFYRDLVQVPESAPRVAELRLLSKEIGWQPGQPMTLSQSLQLLQAAKEVTVNFTAAGRFARQMNRIAPFFNVTFQGPRATVRAIQRNPQRFAWKALSSIAVPSLLLWWWNKDEEWWHELPYADRLLYWHVPFDNPFTGASELARIPKAHEVALFSGLPVMFADAWYRDDPEEAIAFFTEAFTFMAPEPWPVLPLEVTQQFANRDFFWDSPIVPRGEEDVPLEEQYNEYTTRAAVKIGQLMNWSPRRIDHAIASIGGGASMDFLQVAGLGADGRPREKELADIPIAGRLFQRGGQMGTRPRSIEELYGQLEKAQRRAGSLKNPETEDERQHRLQLQDAANAITALSRSRGLTERTSARWGMTQEMSAIAQDALGHNERGQLARGRFQSQRTRAERTLDQVRRRPASAQPR